MILYCKLIRATLTVMAAFCLAGMACRPTTVTVPEIDVSQLCGERAMTEVENFVALGPRHSGTPGAEKAALYLHNRLRELDIPADISAFEDPTPTGVLTFRNVLGEITGESADWIVIGSHFDTMSGISDDFIGANDSGSSTGLLLELGRVLRDHPGLPVNIMLAFFDGEECQRKYGPNDGLHGSRHLARELQQDGRAEAVKAVIIIDMIGDRDLSVTMPPNVTPALRAMALRAAEREGIRHLFKLYRMPILDDHQPFLEAGMPAVLLIDFEFGSAPGLNDYWHTPEDTLDKLSADSLQHIGRVVIQMLNELFQYE